jgi:tetratricopeptide (TPR) repeat protein
MKRLNVRLLVFLGTGALLAMLAVHLVHWWQVGRQASGLLRRAELAENSGETKKAADLLARYVAHRPQDFPVYARFALLLEQVTHSPQAGRQDFLSAQHALEQAVRQQPEDQSLRRRAVEFYMRVGRAKDALDHLEQLKPATGKADGSLELLRARAQLAGGDFKSAAETLQRIIGYQPKTASFERTTAIDAASVPAYELLAQLQRQSLANAALADRIADELVAANQESPLAYLARSRYLRRHYPTDAAKRETARQDVRQALQLAPHQAEVMLAAVEVELAERNYQTAGQLLERGLREHPKIEGFYQWRAALALAQNDSDTADQILATGLKTIPESWNLRLYRAERDLATSNYQRLNETIAQLRNDARYSFLSPWLEGLALNQQGKWSQGAKKLEAAIPALVSRRPDLGAKAYLSLAQCYENLREYDRQLDASRQALRLDQYSILARFSELRALASLGQVATARQHLPQLKRMADVQQVVIPELALWEAALAAKDSGRSPTLADLRAVEARLVGELKDRPDLDDAQRATAHAQLLLEQRRWDDAAARLQLALAQSPRNMDLLLLDLETQRQRVGPAAALARWEEIHKLLGNSVELSIAKAQLLLLVEGKDTENELAKLDRLAEQFPQEQRLRWWRALGTLHYAAGDLQAAQRPWQRVASALADDLPIRLALYELARTNGDQSAMDQLAGQIKALAGDQSATWKFVEANRLVCLLKLKKNAGTTSGGTNNPSAAQAANAAQVRQLIHEARQQRPRWHVLSLLEADLDLLEGNIEAAIGHLQAALEEGPAASATVRRLVDLLRSQQRYEEAKTVMARLGRSNLASPDDQRRLSQVEAATGDLEAAIAAAARVAVDSNSVADHLWLAQLHQVAGNGEQALAALRRAVQTDPKSEQASLALLQQLIQSGDERQAQAEVKRLAKELPSDNSAGVLGLAYQLLGNYAAAEKQFRRALAARPNNAAALRDLAAFHLVRGEIDKAQPLLDQILSQTKSESAAGPQIAWARRTKAQLLAKTGKYDDFSSAFQLIEANVVDGQLPAADLMLLATLAYQRNDMAARRRAIDLLVRQAEQRSLTGSEQLLLASLYEKIGDWPRCEEVMTSLLAAQPKNETVIAAWCEMKLRRGDTNNLDLLVRELDSTSPRGRRIRATLLAKQNQPQRAAEVVRQMVPAVGAPNRLEAVAQLAGFLDDIGIEEEAERYLRAYVKQKPDHELVLGEFLSRRGRVADSLEICERHTADEDLVASTRIAVAVLTELRGELPVDGPEFARVDALLQRGERELPDSKNILLHRAYFEELRGDYAAVVPLYEKYLTLNTLRFDERALAQNNLAMVLAWQGKCIQAQELIDAATSAIGPIPELLDTRAVVALCRGDQSSLNQATADLESALAMQPASVMHFHLALVHLAGGQRAKAREALQAAQEAGFDPARLSPQERPKHEVLVKALGGE